MSLLAYHLAVNDECQDKVIQEVDDVMKGQVLVVVLFLLFSQLYCTQYDRLLAS